MNSSNGNNRNWICSRALRTRQTVALVISTCALTLGAFTAAAAPDSANVTAVNFRPGGRNFTVNQFSTTTTTAQVRRATSFRDLRDKWWRYF
jgi:hypothetical protein